MSIKTVPLPSQEVLKHYFTYCAKTGILQCRHIDKVHAEGPQGLNHWNGRRAGKECVMLSPCKQYYTLKWFRKVLKVHRVIWKLVYGKEPYLLDHKDGNGFNNKLENLREASVADNSKNLFLHDSNKSGVSGVSRFNRYNGIYWQAAIRNNGKRQCLYQGKDFFEAVCRRKSAEVSIGLVNYNHNTVKKKGIPVSEYMDKFFNNEE